MLLAATMLLTMSATVVTVSSDVRGSAPPACRVQGVWDRVATMQWHWRNETELYGVLSRILGNLFADAELTLRI